MKCKHFAEYEGICTNGDCFYRADYCPLVEHQETCVNFEAVKKKVPAEQKQISDRELLQERALTLKILKECKKERKK